MRVFRVYAVSNETNQGYTYTVEATNYSKALNKANESKKDRKDVINSVTELK